MDSRGRPTFRLRLWSLDSRPCRAFSTAVFSTSSLDANVSGVCSLDSRLSRMVTTLESSLSTSFCDAFAAFLYCSRGTFSFQDIGYLASIPGSKFQNELREIYFDKGLLEREQSIRRQFVHVFLDFCLRKRHFLQLNLYFSNFFSWKTMSMRALIMKAKCL